MPATAANFIPSAHTVPLAVGDGFYDQVKKIKYHRYASCLRIQDMTHAGKRGKKVESVALYDIDYVKDENWMIYALTSIITAPDFSSAKAQAASLVDNFYLEGPSPKIEVTNDRGVDVVSPETVKIVIQTPHFDLAATPLDFTINDKKDHNNLPASIPPMRRQVGACKKFYAWATKNRKRLQTMTYIEVRRELNTKGIESHEYLRMD